MEDDEKQKKVETAKEKLAAYIKKKGDPNNEHKKKKKTEGEREEAVSVDVTASPSTSKASIECEGIESNSYVDSSFIQQLQDRVKELEELVEGKELALRVALEGLDSTVDVEVQYRKQLDGYYERLAEFQSAVQQRDDIIKQLSERLGDATQARTELQQEGEQLAQEVALLRQQLQATVQLVQAHSPRYDFALLQNKMLELEDIAQKQTAVIEQLHNNVQEQDTLLKDKDAELEKKTMEYAQYKSKASSEIQQLMRDVEVLHRQVVLKSCQEQEHAEQLSSLRSEMEEGFGLELSQIKEKHRIQFNEEMEALKQQHSDEMASLLSVSQCPSATASAPLESESHLHSQQLSDLEEKLAQMTANREETLSELALYKERVQNLSEELTQVLESKTEFASKVDNLNLEHSEEISLYKFQVNDLNGQLKTLKNKSEQELEKCRQSHAVEVEAWKARIDLLNGELQKVSEAAESYLLRLEKCTKVHEQELGTVRQTHTSELEFLNQRLADRSKLEKEVETLKTQLIDKAALIDRLQSELQQSARNEEQLRGDLLSAQNLADSLNLESSGSNYKEQLNSLNVQLKEKAKLEEELRIEIEKRTQVEKRLTEELQTVQGYMASLQKSVAQSEGYKLQLDKLNKQLQQKIANEEQLKEEYRCREIDLNDKLKKLQSELETQNNNLRSELAACSESFQIKLSIKEEKVQNLLINLEDVQKELIRLQSSNCEQDYKEQIESLSLQLATKTKTEEVLRQELDHSSQELRRLQENGKNLDSFNTELEERLKMEGKHQEEITEAGKAQRDEIDKLNNKIVELLSQQNSLDNEVILLRTQVDEYKMYVQELELMKEQVSNSSVTKEELINDLSICVKSLTDDNTMYKQKLDNLTRRLDDESHRADESLLLRERYETEIAKYKKQIEDLNLALQEAVQAKDNLLTELTSDQKLLNSCKEEIENLNKTFPQEVAQLEQKYSESLKEKESQIELLQKSLTEYKDNYMEHKKQIEDLNRRLKDVFDVECEYKMKLDLCTKEISDLNNQLLELSCGKGQSANSAGKTELYASASESRDEFHAEVPCGKISVPDLEIEKFSSADNNDNLEPKVQCIFSEDMEAGKSYKENLEELERSHQEEINTYQEQVRTLNSKLEELSALCDQFSRRESTSTGRESTVYLDLKDISDTNVYGDALAFCQKELTETREYIKLLKVNLHNEVMTVRAELQNLVAICSPWVPSVLSDSKSSEENGNDSICDQTLLPPDGSMSLEESFVCAAKIHHEMSSLRSHVQSLVACLNNMAHQCHGQELDLAGREESEKSCKKQIEELERMLSKQNEEKKQIEMQLQEMTVQYLTIQSLLAGKEEAEHSLQTVAENLESSSVVMMGKNTELLVRMSELESTLEATTQERKQIGMKYEAFEGEQEKCILEKANLEKIIEDQRVEMRRFNDIEEKLMDLEKSLMKTETERDEFIAKCKILENERAEFVREKGNIEEVINNLNLEIKRLQDIESESKSIRLEIIGQENDDFSFENDSKNKLIETLQAEVARLQRLENDSNFGALIQTKSLNMSAEGNLTSLLEDSFGQDAVQRTGKRNKTMLKWLEQCTALEHEKRELLCECGTLRSRLEERELQEQLFNEELTAAQARCEKLEERLLELEKCEPALQSVIQAKLELEFKIRNLENENRVLKETEDSLRKDLICKNLEYEEKLQKQLQCEYSGSEVEELIEELGEKSKDVILLQEKIKAMEQNQELTKVIIQTLEEARESAVKQLKVFSEEVTCNQTKLEESWRDHEQTKQELGRTRKELALLQLKREQLEANHSRLSDVGLDNTDASILTMQEQVHSMVEELAAEVLALKQELRAERMRSERLVAEAGERGLSELQQRLVLLAQSNAELVREKEALLATLQEQRQLVEKAQERGCDQAQLATALCSQQAELMAQLAAYRQQHTGLLDAVGATGVLQETLRQQKQELMLKLQEKEAIEEQLISERSELKTTQLKMQLLEQQIAEKDNIQQELRRQKSALEADLHEIEDCLRDQVDALQNQKLQLESEIRNRDLRLRKWQLNLRVKEVESKLNSSINEVSCATENISSPNKSTFGDMQDQLDALRAELDETHLKAVARLRQHLNEEFSIRESRLQAAFASEVSRIQSVHKDQLMALHQKLTTKAREIQELKSTQLHNELGIDLRNIHTLKEDHEADLENIQTGLEGDELQLFTVLKHKFHEFSQKVIADALATFKTEQGVLLKQEVSALNAKHEQAIAELRASLEGDRQKALLNVREDLSKQHKEEINALNVQMAKTETYKFWVDISDIKEQSSGTKSSEVMAQLQKMLHQEFVNALKELTRSWQGEWKEKLISLEHQLEECLENKSPSGNQEEENAQPSDDTAVVEKLNSVEELTRNAEELLARRLAACEGALRSVEACVEPVCSALSSRLEQLTAAASVSSLQAELAQARQLAAQLTQEHSAEVAQLREQLGSLEGKHAGDMEELRRYFEQKVAELEKHYSEEITSQHSRRVSDSSCGSDTELASDMYFGGGDHGPLVPALTHICEPYAAETSNSPEQQLQADLDKHLAEYQKQLEATKSELSTQYEGELKALRLEYDRKLDELAKDLSSRHASTLAGMEAGHQRQLGSIKACWEQEVAAACEELLQSAQKGTEAEPTPATVSAATLSGEEHKAALEAAPEHGESSEKAQCDLAGELRRQLARLRAAYGRALQLRVQWCTAQHTALQQQSLSELRTRLEQQHALELQQAVQRDASWEAERVADAAVGAALGKVQLEETIRKELEYELELKVEEVASVMKANSEKEQSLFIENHKRMMSEFLEQHRRDLDTLKYQHQTELAKALRSQALIEATSKQVQTDTPAVPDVTSKQIQTSLADTSSVFDATPEPMRAHLAEADSLSLPCVVPSLTEVHQDTKHLPTEEQACGREPGPGPLHANQVELLQAHYQQQLHAELEEARHEMAQMLEQQIQALLSEDETTPRPQELVLLQRRLSAPYEKQVAELKELHEKRVAALESALSQAKNGGLDQASLGRRLSEVVNERDKWKKVGTVLRCLVEELLNYFSECEEEVNNTLLHEIAKSPSDINENMDNIRIIEDKSELEGRDLEDDSKRIEHSAPKGKRRVHFAPMALDIKTLMNDEEMLLAYIEEDNDLSAKFRAELDNCLEQLRAEAAALMDLSLLMKGADTSVSGFLDLSQELQATRRRVQELERDRERVGREVVSEGIGEQLSPGLSQHLHNLSQLQDRARSMLGERPLSPQDAPQLRLLDALCHEADQLAEEARRDREDLQQQVSAADKQLRATRQFLEEQALEREQERDEFQQRLVRLQEQLRARERDASEHQRLTKEVESLEQQAKEALSERQELEGQRDSLQAELKAAVDKIWLLRDVITELERQVEAKAGRAATLEAQLRELQDLLAEQNSNQQQLNDQLESLRSDMDSGDLVRQVAHLEEQLEQYQPPSGAVEQMKTQIRELETSVEKRTKYLESVHAATASNSCSSPSEDVSIREQLEIFRCATPEELRATAGSSLLGSPVSLVLPLDELGRLQEQLQRLTRAEEAALKRIRDLEMQLRASRHSEEEVCAERDVLQERTAEQLLKIATLQARVDASRCKLETEVQEASEELRCRLRDSEDTRQRLEASLEHKAMEIKQLNATLSQVTEAATAQEKQMTARLLCEEEACQLSKEQLEQLKEEFQTFRQSIEPCAAGRYVPIPVLLETLLADKNAEIDDLRARLRSLGADDSVPVRSPKVPSVQESSAKQEPSAGEPSAGQVPLAGQQPTKQNVPRPETCFCRKEPVQPCPCELGGGPVAEDEAAAETELGVHDLRDPPVDVDADTLRELVIQKEKENRLLRAAIDEKNEQLAEKEICNNEALQKRVVELEGNVNVLKEQKARLMRELDKSMPEQASSIIADCTCNVCSCAEVVDQPESSVVAPMPLPAKPTTLPDEPSGQHTSVLWLPEVHSSRLSISSSIRTEIIPDTRELTEEIGTLDIHVRELLERTNMSPEERADQLAKQLRKVMERLKQAIVHEIELISEIVQIKGILHRKTSTIHAMEILHHATADEGVREEMHETAVVFDEEKQRFLQDKNALKFYQNELAGFREGGQYNDDGDESDAVWDLKNRIDELETKVLWSPVPETAMYETIEGQEVAEYHQAISEPDQEVVEYVQAVSEQDEEVAEYDQAVSEYVDPSAAPGTVPTGTRNVDEVFICNPCECEEMEVFEPCLCTSCVCSEDQDQKAAAWPLSTPEEISPEIIPGTRELAEELGTLDTQVRELLERTDMSPEERAKQLAKQLHKVMERLKDVTEHEIELTSEIAQIKSVLHRKTSTIHAMEILHHATADPGVREEMHETAVVFNEENQRFLQDKNALKFYQNKLAVFREGGQYNDDGDESDAVWDLKNRIDELQRKLLQPQTAVCDPIEETDEGQEYDQAESEYVDPSAAPGTVPTGTSNVDEVCTCNPCECEEMEVFEPCLCAPCVCSEDQDQQAAAEPLSTPEETAASKYQTTSKQLEGFENFEEKITELKACTAEVDELRKHINELEFQAEGSQMDSQELAEVNTMLSDRLEACEAEKEVLLAHVDQLFYANAQMSRTNYNFDELENLRVERNELRKKVDSLSMMESAFFDLAKRTHRMELEAADKNTYKEKYEELLMANQNEAQYPQDVGFRNVEAEHCYLMRQKCELECALADQEDEIRRLISTLDKVVETDSTHEERLKDRLQEMRQRLSSKDEVIDILKQQLAEVPSLQEEVSDLKRRLEKAVATMGGEQQTLGVDTGVDTGVLHEDMQRLTAELQACQSAVAALTQERDELVLAAAQQREDAAGHQNDLRLLQEERSQLLEQVKHYERELELLQSLVKDQQMQVCRCDDSNKGVLEELEAVKRERDRLLAALSGPKAMKQLENEGVASGELAGSVKKFLAQIQNEEMQFLQQQLLMLSHEMDKELQKMSQSSNHELQRKLQDIEALRTTLENHEKQLKKEQEKLSALVVHTSKMCDDNANLGSVRQQREAELGTQRDEIQALKDLVKNMEAELDMSGDIMREKEKEITNLKNLLQQKDGKASALQMQREQDFIQQQRKLQAQITSLGEQVQVLQLEKDSIERKFQDRDLEYQSLTVQLQTLKAQMARAPSDVPATMRELEHTIQELKEENDALQQRVKDLASSEADAEGSIVLEKKYKDLVEEYTSLAAVLKGLRDDLLTLKERERAAEDAVNVLIEMNKELGHETEKIRRRLSEEERMDELVNQIEIELETSASLNQSLLERFSNGRADLDAEWVQDGSDETAVKMHKMTVLKAVDDLVTPLGAEGSSCPVTANAIMPPESLLEENAQLTQQLQQLERIVQSKEHKWTSEGRNIVYELTKIVNKEKQHLREVHKSLGDEVNRSQELLSQLSAQSREKKDLEVEKDMLRHQTRCHESRLHQVMAMLEQQRVKVDSLTQALQKEKSNVKQLQERLQMECENTEAVKMRDAELLEAMRQQLMERLPKAVVQQPPAAYAMAPQHPGSAHEQLPVRPASSPQGQLADLQRQVAALEAEQQQAAAQLAEERRTAQRLLSQEREAARQQRTKLDQLQAHADSLETQLSNTKETLDVRQREMKVLSGKLESLKEVQLRSQETWAAEHRDLCKQSQEKEACLENRISELELQLRDNEALINKLSELEEAVALLESEKLDLREQVTQLQRDLLASQAQEMELARSLDAPRSDPKEVEHFKQKLKAMNADLDQQMKDNSKVALTLAKLVEERQKRHTTIQELLQQVQTMTEREAIMKEAISKLTSEKTALQEEKIALQLSLANSKTELANRPPNSVDTEELENRVNHLFGRYLRAESYRKALAWQKKYLLIALGGYQRTEAETVRCLAHPAGEPRWGRELQHTGRIRFRSAVIVIIALQRMKYLVHRWYRGRHIGGNTVLNRSYSERSVFTNRVPYHVPSGLRRATGSAASVSSWSVPVSAPAAPSLRRTPSHDLPTQPSHSRMNNGINCSPPSQLSPYVDRYDQLQRQLGLSRSPHHPAV